MVILLLKLHGLKLKIMVYHVLLMRKKLEPNRGNSLRYLLRLLEAKNIKVVIHVKAILLRKMNWSHAQRDISYIDIVKRFMKKIMVMNANI